MLKVLQYNIFFGECTQIALNTRLKNICSYILSTSSDVVCMQEVLKDKYSLLQTQLKEEYPHYFPNELNRNYDTVIFSKQSIVKSIEHMYEFTSMGRNLRLIQIDKNDNSYFIATTHFESEFGDSVMKKTYQYRRCVDILTDFYRKKQCPIILCTDSNVCKQSEHVFENAFTYVNNWRDSWIEAGSDPDKELTFDSYTNPILISKYKSNPNVARYKSRLDRIVHISDIHTVDFELVGLNSDVILSDHYGVTCTFSKDKPEGRGEYIPPFISPLKKINVMGKRHDMIKKQYGLKKLF